MTDKRNDLPPDATPNPAPVAADKDRDFAELSELIKSDLPAAGEGKLDKLLEAELAKDFSSKPLLEPEPKRRHRFLKFVLFLLFILIIAGAGLAYWLRTQFYTPVEHDENQTIIVQQGMSTQAIIGKLNQIGIVKNPAAFALYLRAL